MATEKIPVPKPGEGEPIVFFDITLGGKFVTSRCSGKIRWSKKATWPRSHTLEEHLILRERLRSTEWNDVHLRYLDVTLGLAHSYEFANVLDYLTMPPNSFPGFSSLRFQQILSASHDVGV